MMTKEGKKENISKIDRFRYEMMRETQPEEELYEIVVSIDPSVAKI